MSKFFKALEQAERERALGDSAASTAATPPPPGDDAPGSRTATPGPTGVAETPAPQSTETVDRVDVLEEIEAGERPQALDETSEVAVEIERPARRSTRSAVELERPEAEPVAVREPDESDPHLVSLHAPTSFAAEQYRTLRHIIEHEGVQVIAVTSPGVGDGKTTTAMNLAGALAQAPDARVLVIDCDLRRPTVGKFIGLSRQEPGKGLVDLLLDRRLPLDVAIVSRRMYNLDILPAGQPPVNPYELLKSPRLPLLIDEARKRYNFVILDTPPAIPLPDCRVLGRIVDAFVLIVSANRTPRRLVQETLETLERGKVLGFIFNKDQAPVGGYYEYQAYFPRNGTARSRLGRMVSRMRNLRRKPATRRKK
jgi:capsular exopolysaccharide synthesis family protein